MLTDIWRSFYPHEEYAETSVMWKGCGFQREDPVSDVRGGGELALRNFLYLLQNHGELCNRMSQRQRNKRHETNMEKGYPFAAASINITRMCAQILHIIKTSGASGDFSISEQSFWSIINEPEAFNKLFVIAFVLLDSEFVHVDASYMEFNNVLESCKVKLVRALQENVGKGTRSTAQLMASLGLETVIKGTEEQKECHEQQHQHHHHHHHQQQQQQQQQHHHQHHHHQQNVVSYDLLGLDEWSGSAACNSAAVGMSHGIRA
jgi:hypothetical protein